MIHSISVIQKKILYFSLIYEEIPSSSFFSAMSILAVKMELFWVDSFRYSNFDGLSNSSYFHLHIQSTCLSVRLFVYSGAEATCRHCRLHFVKYVAFDCSLRMMCRKTLASWLGHHDPTYNMSLPIRAFSFWWNYRKCFLTNLLISNISKVSWRTAALTTAK